MKSKKRKLIFEGALTSILVIFMVVIVEITEIKFNFEWIHDIDVWINDFFVNTFVFLLMSIILSKITNQFMNFGISYAVSVLVGNIIVLDSSNFCIAPKMILFAIYGILTMSFLGWMGYHRGKRIAQKKIDAEKRECIQRIREMDDKTRSELCEIGSFIEEHPQECDMIDKFGVDFLIAIVGKIKQIEKR